MLFRRRLLVVLLKLSDVSILAISLVATYWLVYGQTERIDLGTILSSQVRVIDLAWLAGAVVVWHLAFRAFKLYRSRRLGSPLQDSKDIIKATSSAAAAFGLAGGLLRIPDLSLRFLAVLWVFSTMFTIGFRILLRSMLGRIRHHGRNLRHVVIVGTNGRAYRFAESLGKRKELGYQVLGYIDDRIHEARGAVQLLGTLDEFADILRWSVIDEVVVALPIKSFYEQIRMVVKDAQEQGVLVHHLLDLFETEAARTRVEVLDETPVVTIATGPPSDWRFVAKRAIDIVVSAVLLILTMPVLVATALAIRLTSPGPILFVQPRVGYNKRIFKLYKFRTMVMGAERMQQKLETQNEMDGPVFKIRNDPRITPIGRWLRRMSIDELPQLFNVLKGDMSLVGPRPLPVRDYNGFDKDWQRRRFSVLPGITCTWQVSGRNNISFERWMKLDMEYIANWTLLNDLVILLRTVRAVFSGRGAA